MSDRGPLDSDHDADHPAMDSRASLERHPKEPSASSTYGLSHILAKYSDRCSVTGVSFIRSSKNPVVKGVWSALLLIAIGFMIFHLYRLFVTYFSYKTHTAVTLSFSQLQFPVVTICNVNPLRLSQRKKASPNLNLAIDAVNPESLSAILAGMVEFGAAPVAADYGSDWNMSDNIDPLPRTDAFDDAFTFSLAQISSPRESFPAKSYSPSADMGSSVPAGTVTMELKSSAFYDAEKLFKEIYSAEEEEARIHMGHQIEDLLLHCYFAGKMCEQTQFKRTLSTNFGNCYTIENSHYLSRKSGPTEGLVLILNVEVDEYVASISEGKGVQLVLHEQGTLPFPEDEGINIAAGMETGIGLRQLEIFRQGKPYGKCTSVEHFEKEYGVKYTRMTCQKACKQIKIREQCHCYDEMRQEMNTVLQNPQNLLPCRNYAQLLCLQDIEEQFGADDECNCDSPCSERKFEKTISMRPWPSASFANLIVESACKSRPGEQCDRLRSKQGENLTREFIKLNIYFEDLNYEQLTEQVDYELSQFISDIGGTIGLWIGLSILGIVEVFHLIFDIARYLCCRMQGKAYHTATEAHNSDHF